ncbi:hypothetical protein [Saccharothrix stipae]
MIMTIVTQDGKLQAAAVGDVRPPDQSKPVNLGRLRGGLMAGPGQIIQVVEVPDTFSALFGNPAELTTRLTGILAERGLL